MALACYPLALPIDPRQSGAKSSDIPTGNPVFESQMNLKNNRPRKVNGMTVFPLLKDSLLCRKEKKDTSF